MYSPREIRVRLNGILNSAASPSEKAAGIGQLQKGVRSAIELLEHACDVLNADGDIAGRKKMLGSIQALGDCDRELTQALRSCSREPVLPK